MWNPPPLALLALLVHLGFAASRISPGVHGGRFFRADGLVTSISMSTGDEMVTLDESGAILRFRLPEGERIEAIPSPCKAPAFAQHVAISPDGRWIAVACSSHIAVGKLGSGTWAMSPEVVFDGSARSLQWSGDNRTLMVSAGGAFLLDTSARVIAKDEGPSPLLPIGDGVWAGTKDIDGTMPVRAWSAARGQLWSVRLPLGLYEGVRGLALVTGNAPLVVFTDADFHLFQADGQFTSIRQPDRPIIDAAVGVGSEIWIRHDETISRITPEGKELGTTSGLGSDLFASPDGRWVASGGNGVVEAWRADGTRLTPVDGLAADANVLEWSRDGRYVAASDGRRVVRLTVASGTMETLPIHGVSSLAWGPRGELVFGGDAGLFLWKGSARPIPIPVGEDVEGAWFDPKGGIVVYTVAREPSEHGEYELWSLKPLQRTGRGHRRLGCSPEVVRPSLDARYVAAIPISWGDACILDGSTGDFVARIGKVDDVVWRPDGTARIVAHQGEVSEGPEIWTWPGSPPRPGEGWPVSWHMRLSPDGTSAVTWEQGQMTVWDTETRTARHVQDTVEPGPVRFSPDGRWLAFTGSDGLLRVTSARE